MAIREVESDVNVVDAARSRIINVFQAGERVIMSTSGGKDSICMMHLTYKLIIEKLINRELLTIQFVDEEAMFDDVIEIVKQWRQRFMEIGVPFEWYCVQARHYNCLNTLSDSESFIMWDESKKDRWVRPMPDFAIKDDPQLRERVDTYQTFLTRKNRGTIAMIGIRTAESMQRRNYMAKMMSNKNREESNEMRKFYPIYDWTDDDVWLYIKQNKLDFPITYLHLYQIGLGRSKMRISQFFSIDTARCLARMAEHSPNLMERVIRREPNAYIAALYWDSEMFRSSKKTKDKGDIDYRKLTLDMIQDDRNFPTPGLKKSASDIKALIMRYGMIMENKAWKLAYQIISAGDPKNRTFRALYATLFSDYTNKAKREVGR